MIDTPGNPRRLRKDPMIASGELEVIAKVQW